MNQHIILNRFPLKHLADAAALAKIAIKGNVVTHEPLDLAGRLRCLKFYFTANGVERMHVGTARSGTLWSELGMSLAIDLANGGDGEYTHADDILWPTDGIKYRRLDWRIPMIGAEKTYIRMPDVSVGEHLYWHSRLPYSRIRTSRLKHMRIVISTRNILETLESRFFKHAGYWAHPEVSADDPDTFNWDKYLSEAIEFCNSWGDALTWHPNIRHYRFEDLKADPIGTHSEILDFWGFDIPRDCVEEGFRRASKEEMKKRIPPATDEPNYRVSFRSKAERGKVLSPERKRYTVDRLNQELVHPLGHTYDYDTDYGNEYA